MEPNFRRSLEQCSVAKFQLFSNSRCCNAFSHGRLAHAGAEAGSQVEPGVAAHPLRGLRQAGGVAKRVPNHQRTLLTWQTLTKEQMLVEADEANDALGGVMIYLSEHLRQRQLDEVGKQLTVAHTAIEAMLVEGSAGHHHRTHLRTSSGDNEVWRTKKRRALDAFSFISKSKVQNLTLRGFLSQAHPPSPTSFSANLNPVPLKATSRPLVRTPFLSVQVRVITLVVGSLPWETRTRAMEFMSIS